MVFWDGGSFSWLLEMWNILSHVQSPGMISGHDYGRESKEIHHFVSPILMVISQYSMRVTSPAPTIFRIVDVISIGSRSFATSTLVGLETMGKRHSCL